MNDWSECLLGDVVELKRGYDLPHRDRRDGPFPIVSSSGVSGTHEAFKAEAPGVVTGRYGTIGEVYYIETPYWPLNTSLYVRDFKGNDPRFISYFLRTLDYYAYSDKAAVPGVNRNHLHLAPVLIPPLNEQRAIASVLGSLDDKIKLNRRMNRTLEQMAAAIFREHWERANAAEVAVPVAELERRAILLIGDGYRAKRSELSDSGPPFIRAGNVKGRVDPSSAERLSVESAERAGVKNSQLWDSVFTTKGTVGRLGLVTRSTGDVVYAPQVCFWRSQSDKALHPLVLHEWMKSVLFTRQWQAVKGQTDMADFVSLTDQRSMTMDLLEPDDQHELGQRLQPLYDLIDSNAAENQALSDTRDALLPKLMSGEVRIRGVAAGSEVASCV